jgi:hypothetical protein
MVSADVSELDGQSRSRGGSLAAPCNCNGYLSGLDRPRSMDVWGCSISGLAESDTHSVSQSLAW